MNKKKLTLLIALSIIFVLILDMTIFKVEAKLEKEAVGVIMNYDAEVYEEKPKEEIKTKVIEEEKIEPIVETITIKEEEIILPTGEYPEAQLVWDTMRSWGWTPETCAGIIGNIMAEIGGGTLNFSNWNSNGRSGYGLIQWTGGRRALIKQRYGDLPNIIEQLTHMKDELFGINCTTKQVNDNVLNTIMNDNGKQTPESIAMAFATYYERCAVKHRAKRQGYARAAYKYFMAK